MASYFMEISPRKVFLLVLYLSLPRLPAQVFHAGEPSVDTSLAAQDTAPLYPEPPFYIHPSKRLEEQELKDKREGTFITGLPRWEYDPIRGFGIGAEGFLYVNKTRKDPFFAYSPIGIGLM